MSVNHERVGSAGHERSLDEVLGGGDVLEVLHPLLGPGQALETQLAHDLPDQLLVDDKTLFDLEGRPDAQHPIGPTGSGVDLGDGISEEQSADRPIRGTAELHLVIRERPRPTSRQAARSE